MRQVYRRQVFKQRLFGRPMCGFTLIELMVTLTVLAIVIGIAVPSFNNLIRNNRSVALGEELATALNFARSEAVKRGARVSLCASNTGSTCAGTWTDGWMVFVDNATTDTANAPTVGAVLRVWQAPAANAAISVQQNSVNSTFVRYNSLGALGRTGNVAITSQVSGCTGEAARTITINRGGVVSVANSNCS